MAKKLEELNGWELTNALLELAEPIGNLTSDDKFWSTFEECTRQGLKLKQKDAFRFLLKAYANLFPILFGEEHKMDTFRILAVIEGQPANELMKKNGAELLKDCEKAFKEQLDPFFFKFTHTGVAE